MDSKPKPADAIACESANGDQERSPDTSLTRRSLIRGAAATPILLSSAAGAAAVLSYDLRLALSLDGKLLTVTERPVFKDAVGGLQEKPLATWRAPAVLFGPKAWLNLVKAPSQQIQILKIHNGRYGDLDGVELTIEFFRADKALPWQLRLVTNLWGNSGHASDAVPFQGFAKDNSDVRLTQSASAGQVDRTLRRIFREHVDVESAGHAVSAGLAATGSWLLSRKPPRKGDPQPTKNFMVLDGQATLTTFEFGWRTGEAIIKDGVPRASEMFVSGNGKALPDKGATLTIGAGHAVKLELLEPKLRRDFEVRLAISPLDPARDQVVSKLTVGKARLAVYDSHTRLASPITTDNLIVSSTVLPTNQVKRTVLWGEAGLPIGKDTAVEEIVTPIGRLLAGALPQDTAVNAQTETPAAPGAPVPSTPPPARKNQPEPNKRKAERELFMRAACGDRGGAPGATVWAIDDLKPKHNGPRTLRRLALDVALHAANIALPDVSFSRLTFRDKGAELRLIFEDGQPISEIKPSGGEFARGTPPCFVWLGPLTPGTKPHAEIDLSRATLTAARDYDLVKLRFQFLDFVLVLAPTPVIRPARSDCRLIETENGKFKDSRPVLVAEFDPQHVFEEAIFRPDLPPLPDVETDDATLAREIIIAELEKRKNDSPAKRAEYRDGMQKKKKEIEKKKQEEEAKKKKAKGEDAPVVDGPFATFAEKFKTKAAAAELPADQQIYVGPFALDADAMHLARGLFGTDLADTIKQVVLQTFSRVVTEVIPRLDNAKLLLKLPGTKDPDVNLDSALRNEALFEESEPVYAAFRTFYREKRLKDEAGLSPKDSPNVRALLWRTEFLSEDNRPPIPAAFTSRYPSEKNRQDWFDPILESFLERVRGADKIEDLMEARLSGTSRLAFHVNCLPPSVSSRDAGLPENSGAGPSVPSGGGFAYDPLPFTFEALTDWSRHEPAVTLRARKLFTALPWGVVPPIGDRAANLGDHDVLAYQGFKKGFITAEERLGEVRKSMEVKPSRYETAIEIPSRLIMSTAQDAIWHTVRRLPPIKDLNDRLEPTRTRPAPQLLAGAEQQAYGKRSVYAAALWSARLAVEDVNPGLRIVDTPDFRPLVLAPARTVGALLPSRGAPPRGPLAPWFIGPEQLESATLTADAVNATLPDDSPGKGVAPVCIPPADSASLPEKIFEVLKWLCGRQVARDAVPISWRIFRTTLDAYDRHQLVMLSSAYGLPVIGKRQQSDTTDAGPLVVDSGQFEPGDYALSDARNDQAIYRPIALNVKELSLTALGGSFSHDTAFQPSAGADDLWGRKLFEGFSIERWQQDIVLGRDVLGQVVYKGYLFPFGHRASMIKRTERVFLKTPNQGIKAILRQRIFLQIADPAQRYPALGQPHRGALWCGESVVLRTTRTPDLLDPTSGEIKPGAESINGRIDLGAGNPGLAFFPRVDITKRGLVNFELLVDVAASRMPLVFVDNIAATNAASLGRLIELYEGTAGWAERRTLVFNGQKLRFAPENRSGDTLLATESVQVGVHGRFKSYAGGWSGDLSTYNTTGALEGARQPPFYPAMDFALVRLEQVERFTGGARRPIKVQYDGHYVRHGFAPVPAPDATEDDGTKAHPEWNPLEVYLNLCQVVTSGMGDNGDRAAALGRPASHIVAISREKGPLGADRFAKYERTGPENPRAAASEEQSWVLHLTDKPDSQNLLTAGKWQQIESLATYFNHRLPTSAKKKDESGDYDAVDAAPNSPVDTLPRPDSNPAGQALKTLQVLQSYFSGDAKLLGTVKIKHLLALLDLDDFLTAVPALKETLDYGTAALNKIENRSADLAADVRTRVILPLNDAVSRLQAQWAALDAKLTKTIGPDPAKAGLSLRTIYPEIDTGLTDLARKLQAASQETDPALLAKQLSELYESGRRFIRVLSTVAANPVERLKDAATRAINNLVAGFAGDFQALLTFKKDLETVIAALQSLTPAQMATWILARVDTVTLAEELSLTFAVPSLADAGRRLGAQPAEVTYLEGLDVRLKAALPTGEALLRHMLATVPGVLNGSTKPEDALDKAVGAWIGEKAPSLRALLQDIAKDVTDSATIEVEAVRLAAVKALNELRQRVSRWGTSNALPEIQVVRQTVLRALALFERIKTVVTALKSGDVATGLRAVDAFASDVLGVDISALAAPEAQEYLAKIMQIRARTAAFVSAQLPGPAEDLAREVEACFKARIDNNVVLPADPAKTPFKQLGDVLVKLEEAKQRVTEFTAQIGTIPKVPALDGVTDFHVRLTVLVDDLIQRHRTLYCEVVETTAALAEIPAWVSTTELDRAALDHLTALQSRLDRASRAIAAPLAAIATRVQAFVSNSDNQKFLLGGVLLGGAAKLVFDHTQSGDALKVPATRLQAIATEVEKESARALEFALTRLLALATNGSAFGADIAEALRKAAVGLREGLQKADREFGTAAGGLIDSLKSLNENLTAISRFRLVTPEGPFERIRQVLDANIDGLNKPVREAFGAAQDTLDSALNAARVAEAQALAAWRTLQLRLLGLPDALKTLIERQVVASGTFGKMAAGYGELLRLRKEALEQIARVPLLSSQARRVLLVPPVYGNDCPIDDRNKPIEDLLRCDRLAEELDILKSVTLPAGDAPLDPAVRTNVLRFFGSWGNKTAAPLVISGQVRDLAAHALKGDVLALIDVSAFRDAIEDAISQLIPTRATLSYDFRRAILKEPSKTALFQAKKGTEFSLSVRAVVNLLKPDNVDFRATGSLGPFDVKLVGQLVDAITLKFDGAVFEMVGGSKPRFQVAYQDFEIGKDLEFAQKLQSFLSPKDGNGIFLQPLTRTAGIEAGYGIDLGSIGCGATSFFNVTLNVSAELPFTDSEALFKVSLGRRLRPFTMSVIPFAGSGYFSIFAAPDGIRGFEASFEFGGGASLGFGPLQAQARVMVGVFIRILRVDGTNTCTISGTFFAGGSASIWIFSFATSLYVRLGRSDGGAMYGEAIYSFSFSLGIVDYDYSITAFKREQQMGSGGGGAQRSGALEPRDDEPTRFAFADDRTVKSDAPVAYRTRGQAPPRPMATSDVMSEAVGPDRDLKTYLNYFDLSLVDED